MAQEPPHTTPEPFAGGGGGRSADGRASKGDSNPGQDPFTTGGEAAARHEREVRARSTGSTPSIPAGGRDGVEQPPATVVGERLRAVEEEVRHVDTERVHDGFTGEANEAEARLRAGLPPA